MEQVIYLIANLFHIYAVYECSQMFFQKYPQRKTAELFCYAGYFIINSAAYFLFSNTIINLLSNLIPFFGITLLYRTTWQHRMIGIVSIYLLGMAADVLCVTISIWFEYTLFFTSGFASALLFLTIVRIMVHFRLYKNDTMPRLHAFYMITAILIPLGSIFLAHYIARKLSWRSLVAAVVLLLINVSIFSLYDHLIHLMQEQHNTQLIEQQNRAYRSELEVMQQSQMRLRFLRHDMKNHLFQIQHYLEIHDMDGLYNYISDAEASLNQTQNMIYTQHEAINSILNYKLSPLREQGVSIDVCIQLPEHLPYSVFDLNVLLGNLLDNAIEATEKVFPKSKRQISLVMKEKLGSLQLCVKNRFDSKLPEKSSTRKADKRNHGLGLKSVADIVQRYHGKIWVVPEKDWFEVNVIIYQPEEAIRHDAYISSADEQFNND